MEDNISIKKDIIDAFTSIEDLKEHFIEYLDMDVQLDVFYKHNKFNLNIIFPFFVEEGFIVSFGEYVKDLLDVNEINIETKFNLTV